MIHLINQINALNIKYSSNDLTFNLPVLGFCLSKYETAFGSFFSATYNKNCSLDDQAKQPNCAGKEIEKKKTNGLTEGAFQNPEVAGKTGHFEILKMKY